MNSIISQFYPNILLGVILLITLFLNVWIGVFSFLLALAFIKKANIWWFLFPIFIISVIEFTQYTTYDTGDYDILRYYTTYDILAKSNLEHAFFLVNLTGQFSFYYIVFIISQILPDDPRWFSFFFPLISGTFLYLSYNNFSEYFKDKRILDRSDKPMQVILWIFGFVFIISIINLGNIVRQYFAFSLLIYSYSRFLIGRRYWITLVLCFFAHWSMIIFIALFLIFKSKPQKLALSLLPALALGVVNVASILALFNERILAWLESEILGIDKTLMVVLFVSTLSLFLSLVKIDHSKKLVLILMSIMFYEYIFIWRSSLATRFFYNFNEFFATIIPILPFIKMKNRDAGVIRLLWIIPCILLIYYNSIQLYRSNFEYLIFSKYGFWNSAIDILSTPLPSGLL